MCVYVCFLLPSPFFFFFSLTQTEVLKNLLTDQRKEKSNKSKSKTKETNNLIYADVSSCELKWGEKEREEEEETGRKLEEETGVERVVVQVCCVVCCVVCFFSSHLSLSFPLLVYFTSVVITVVRPILLVCKCVQLSVVQLFSLSLSLCVCVSDFPITQKPKSEHPKFQEIFFLTFSYYTSAEELLQMMVCSYSFLFFSLLCTHTQHTIHNTVIDV